MKQFAPETPLVHVNAELLRVPARQKYSFALLVQDAVLPLNDHVMQSAPVAEFVQDRVVPLRVQARQKQSLQELVHDQVEYIVEVEVEVVDVVDEVVDVVVVEAVDVVEAVVVDVVGVVEVDVETKFPVPCHCRANSCTPGPHMLAHRISR